MKFHILQSTLNNALSSVTRAVPSRPNHPVLATVKVIASGEKVTLIGFDLSISISANLTAEIEESGEYCVFANILHSIVSKLPNEELTIDISEGTCKIFCGKSFYTIPTLSSDEFPDIPTISGDEFSLPSTLFLDGLRHTLNAASTEETKQNLTGVNIKVISNKLTMAATDGHRLSVVSFELENSVDDFVVTVPSKALGELQKTLLARKPDEIEISYESGQILFKVGDDWVLISRILEGTYPNYEQLIPKEFAGNITVERKNLVSSIERLCIIVDPRSNVVKWEVSAEDQELSLSSSTADVGSGKESLPVQFSGDPVNIGFNAKYLLDGLKCFSSHEVVLKSNQPTSPVILSPLGGVDAIYLIMPVSIRA